MSTIRPAKPPSTVALEARALPMCTTSLPSCLVSSVMQQFQCLLTLRGAKVDSRICFEIFIDVFEKQNIFMGFLRTGCLGFIYHEKEIICEAVIIKRITK